MVIGREAFGNAQSSFALQNASFTIHGFPFAPTWSANVYHIPVGI
jgi:hypothetical protein